MAQGFNMGRYIPPDLAGQSLNQASGKGHALGHRASKLASDGVLVVRFECPFAIWCTTCHPEAIIAQGVRFNAEKKKVGNYYSTPIWQFRFKHIACGGWIEVRTDPKNAEYVVVEGGRRRDTGEEKILDGEIRIDVSEEEKERLEREGGFGALEKKVVDKQVHDEQGKRIEALLKHRSKGWADPYERSRALRREFRAGRRQRQADEKTGEALQEKFGIGIEMMAPREDDGERAKLIDFGEVKTGDVASQPMFQVTRNAPAMIPEKDRGKRGRKSEEVAKMQKLALEGTLRGNTRSVVDPFLKLEDHWGTRTKRAKTFTDENVEERQNAGVVPKVTGLVGYDSDSS